MSGQLPFVCQTCALSLHLSSQWRAAGCPVEFAAICAECGTAYRVLVRLQPTFFTVPASSHFDWHVALAHELFNAYRKAAAAEADLLGPPPADWFKLKPTEKRLWLSAHRHYLTRSVA